MNEMAAVQASAPARSLMEIEADILAQKRTIGRSIVIIGQDLIEAKSKMEHGLWGTWLEERVNFSQSTAENYMKIAEQVGGDSLLLNLPYTKILALLAVPAEERETFATANNIEEKSVSEIKKLIRERDEARQEAEAAKAQSAKDSSYFDKLARLNDAKDNKIMALEKALEKERAKEPDTVTVEKEVPPADYEAVKAQAAKLEDQLHTAMVRLNQAEDSLEEAEERASRAQAEAQRAQMERIDSQDADDGDPMEVSAFAHACFDFTGALYAAPIGARYFAGKSAEDIQRYRLVVNSVLHWAQNTLHAIDEAEAQQAAGGDDYVVA